MWKFAQWLNNLNAKVTKLNIRGAPRFLLLTFAGIFIAIGLLYVTGLLIELYFTARINYKAINDFISSYFGVASVAAFGVIGKALIDADADGKPDVWEDKDKEGEQNESISEPWPR